MINQNEMNTLNCLWESHQYTNQLYKELSFTIRPLQNGLTEKEKKNDAIKFAKEKQTNAKIIEAGSLFNRPKPRLDIA